MHSDDDSEDRFRAHLFEYADGVLDGAAARAIRKRLETDPELAADLAAIADMRMRAQVWHDEQPPAWQPPRIASRRWPAITQWFPTVASAAALLVAVAVWVREPVDLPATRQADQGTKLVATSAADPQFLEAVLDASRDQRQRELASLVRLMTVEMDRRSIETEESLRYIIAHQMQGQQELDALYKRVDHIDGPTGANEARRAGKLQ
jgi:hypothetical protein